MNRGDFFLRGFGFGAENLQIKIENPLLPNWKKCDSISNVQVISAQITAPRGKKRTGLLGQAVKTSPF
ncbi:MAG TPA: hypothetical protein H9912_06410, partial [Candidatus Eisenbergiella stercorigallinarum]|nr:hypothetical protein [Candidatus Eisenbergiella stercorigallinarum]